MGVIQKQALKTTIISFLGVGIGVASQLLFAIVLSKTEFGTLSLLNSISNMLAAVFCLGFAQITFQIFPKFRNESNGNSGYLLFGIAFSVVGILLAELTFYFFQDIFVGTELKHQLIRSLAYLIYPIVIFRIFFRNIDVYLRMLFNSVQGALLEGVFLKFTILIGAVVFMLGWMDYTSLAFVYTFALCIPGIGILIIAFLKTEKVYIPKRGVFQKKDWLQIMNYGFFGVISTVSGIIVITIDQLMINRMIGTAAVGLYAIMFFASSIISIPSRGIRRIISPVLSEYWKKSDYKNIQIVYEKSVINQSVIGIYIFAIGWACIEPSLVFVPKYSDGLYAFFFLGLGQLFDMMTGVNMDIIATSKSYKINTYFNLVLAFLVIVFNYVFIQKWQITGAAAASAIAMLLINFGRWYFLKMKYNLQPFSKNIFIMLCIGGGIIAGVTFIPINITPIWKILFYVFTITLLYWGLVFKFNLAPDMSQWLLKVKKRLIK